MFWIIHALVGMLIGAYVDSWIVVLILSIISHFIFDMLPHWDGYFDKAGFLKTGIAKISKGEVIIRGIDFILMTLIVGYFYFRSRNHLLLLGAFGALLPDIIKIFNYTKLKKNKIYYQYLIFHSKIQNDLPMLYGLLLQFIIGAAIIFWLYRVI